MSIRQPTIVRRLRMRFLQSDHTIMVLLAVAVGLLGGLCAVGFRKFIHLVQVHAWRMPAFTLEGIREHPPWQVILIPAVGGLIVGLIIHYFAREAKGHGVPEVMEAVARRGGRIRTRVVLAKLVASGVCIGTGGSVGREGPIVQIGSALGSGIGQFLHVGERRLRTLVGCGAAAGIAATFNAPIAGVLFASEVILGDFAPSQLTPIVIASVTATVIGHHYFGILPAFVIPHYTLVSHQELVIYAILGLISGLIALLFIKVLYAFEDYFDGPLSVIPAPLRAALGGVLIGVLALRFPEIMGVGYEAIELALNEQLIWQTLLLLAMIKILAVSVTIGSGGSGGVFAPSLMIGAMAGGALGTAVHTLWPTVTASSGAYALAGAGAVVAATTHAPLTALMIIFELTNNYNIILPLMISCVIATLIASRLNRASIYTMKLLRRGLDIYKGRTLDILSHLRVRDAMREPHNTVSPQTHLIKLVSLFMDHKYSSLFVVDEEVRLLGIIAFDDLRPFIKASGAIDQVVIAHDVMLTSGYPVVAPDEGLDKVMRELGRYHYEVPVADNGKLIGTILAEDVIDRYNAEMFKQEMASRMASSLPDAGRFTPMPGVMGLNLAEIPVPATFVGSSCAELDLRNRYGVTVILVKGQEKEGHQVDAQAPDAHYVFADGDVMLALGDPQSVDKLQRML